MSYGPIGWILPSEVFPLSMRSKGVALSTASNWLNNCTLKSYLRLYPPTESGIIRPVLIGLVTPELLELSPKYIYRFSIRADADTKL